MKDPWDRFGDFLLDPEVGNRAVLIVAIAGGAFAIALLLAERCGCF